MKKAKNHALLCKSEDVKTFGYKKIFEPFLRDLVTLEQQGVFIDHLEHSSEVLFSV